MGVYTSTRELSTIPHGIPVEVGGINPSQSDSGRSAGILEWVSYMGALVGYRY